jgi:hypothetical protein
MVAAPCMRAAAVASTPKAVAEATAVAAATAAVAVIAEIFFVLRKNERRPIAIRSSAAFSSR